jgi:hypothetical protein
MISGMDTNPLSQLALGEAHIEFSNYLTVKGRFGEE